MENQDEQGEKAGPGHEDPHSSTVCLDFAGFVAILLGL
jgi:hypothetical protein